MRFGPASTLTAAFVAFALATTACADEGADGEAAGPTAEETTGATGATGATGETGEEGPTVVTAVEYKFHVDGGVPAGPATLELRNDGEEEHELVLLQLEQGRTIDDVTSFIEEQGADAPPPDWVTIVGGTFARPGKTSKQAVQADLGADAPYVMICFVTTADGVTHAELGMVQELEVA